MSDTVDHTGKVPLTVWVDPPPEGKERHAIFQGFMADGAESWMLVLRPIMPATVMVEMTREDAEKRAAFCSNHEYRDCIDPLFLVCRERAAARAALARKPCPAMVCLGALSESYLVCSGDNRKEHIDRRPCKHYEGHGGEHE